MRFFPIFLTALFFPAVIGCDAAPAARTPPAAVRRDTIGGFVYDPAAPLAARVTPLGGEGIRSYAVRYSGAGGESVPGLLVLPPGQKGRVPCALLLHGMGGSKDMMLLPALGFARRGYAVLAIDIAEHGERPRSRQGTDAAVLPLPEVGRAAARTVVDLRRAVDFLETRPEIDARRIGFVGISLGGILGGVFAAHEPRVRATALWAAGGDWGKLVAESTHPFAQQLRKRGEGNPNRVAAQMAEVDPARVAAAIAPRPLLMINGTTDSVVPRSCTDALYAAARQPKQLVLLPGGHIPDAAAMLDRTLSWLDTHLK